jgi:hypothetical protein
MKIATCFLLMSAGVCSALLADEPSSPAPQPSAAQPSAAQPAAAHAPAPGSAPGAGDANSAASAPTSASAATPAAGAPGATADKSAAVNAAPTAAEINQMRSRGYKPVNRKGTLVFCRDEGIIGSSFQRTHCSTLKQLKEADN